MKFDEWASTYFGEGLHPPAGFKDAWDAATKAERVACGEIANKKAAEVLAKNTYRGRVSSAASFAAGMLEDVGTAIRMRSN